MAPGKRPVTVESNDHLSRKKARTAQAPDAIQRRATRSMTTDASRKAVFDTVELLEHIILCLPMKTIFGIQRVSQQFRDVIATSAKIQEKMFLRLRVPEEVWVLESSVGAQAPWAEEARFRKVDMNLNGNRYRPAVLNPLLEVMAAEQHLSAAERVYHNDTKTEFAYMMLSQSHFGAHPSFLKTYITDPPGYMTNAEITAGFLLIPTEEDVVYGTLSGGDVVTHRPLTIGDVVRARTTVDLRWDAPPGLGDSSYTDAQLEEVIDYTAPIAMGNDSSPCLTLPLWNLVIPTENEWRAVSSQHVDVTS